MYAWIGASHGFIQEDGKSAVCGQLVQMQTLSNRL